MILGWLPFSTFLWPATTKAGSSAATATRLAIHSARSGSPVSAFGVRAGLRAGLDGGGLSVTPAGLWDLSPFYSLVAGT